MDFKPAKFKERENFGPEALGGSVWGERDGVWIHDFKVDSFRNERNEGSSSCVKPGPVDRFRWFC